MNVRKLLRSPVYATATRLSTGVELLASYPEEVRSAFHRDLRILPSTLGRMPIQSWVGTKRAREVFAHDGSTSPTALQSIVLPIAPRYSLQGKAKLYEISMADPNWYADLCRDLQCARIATIAGREICDMTREELAREPELFYEGGGADVPLRDRQQQQRVAQYAPAITNADESVATKHPVPQQYDRYTKRLFEQWWRQTVLGSLRELVQLVAAEFTRKSQVRTGLDMAAALQLARRAIVASQTNFQDVDIGAPSAAQQGFASASARAAAGADDDDAYLTMGDVRSTLRQSGRVVPAHEVLSRVVALLDSVSDGDKPADVFDVPHEAAQAAVYASSVLAPLMQLALVQLAPEYAEFLAKRKVLRTVEGLADVIAPLTEREAFLGEKLSASDFVAKIPTGAERILMAILDASGNKYGEAQDDEDHHQQQQSSSSADDTASVSSGSEALGIRSAIKAHKSTIKHIQTTLEKNPDVSERHIVYLPQNPKHFDAKKHVFVGASCATAKALEDSGARKCTPKGWKKVQLLVEL
jgi:hypothetical protein